MSSKLELAAAKWRAKTASAVNKWQNAVSSPSTIAAWVRGIRQFIGQSPSQEVAELYYEGVTSPSAANKYQTNVTSEHALRRYKENLIAGLTAKLTGVTVSGVVTEAYAKAGV
jgi:hypothetical protein